MPFLPPNQQRQSTEGKESKVNYYTGTAVCSVTLSHRHATGTHVPYGITQCYLPSGRGDIPAIGLPQPKLIFDLATSEECKAELT